MDWPHRVRHHRGGGCGDPDPRADRQRPSNHSLSSLMQALPGIVQGIRDPLGTILQLLTGVLSHFIATARTDLNAELSRYLFTTADPTASGIRALTANPAIARLNGSLAPVADVLVGAVLAYASLRSIFEHSIRARYALHLVIPRVMAALVMVHGSIYFIQTAIDLNNPSMESPNRSADR